MKWGLISYASLYVALSGHVAYDFETSHKKWLKDHTKNELVIKDVPVSLEDRVRNVTFVGEAHIYNDKESEFSEDFIKQFDVVFLEGAGGLKFHNLSDKIFLTVISVPVGLSQTYLNLAEGRLFTNSTLEDFASQYGIPVLYLEEESGGGIRELTFQQKAKLFGYHVVGAAVGPALYYLSKSDIMNPKSEESERFKAVRKDVDQTVNLDLRNVQMTHKLLEYLKTKNPHQPLVVVGNSHIPGMLKYLDSLSRKQ